MTVQKWYAAELAFSADREIALVGEAEADCVFFHAESKTVLRIPMFWDGGTTWRARFALTETGIWNYRVEENASLGLSGQSGQVECVPYEGKLEIYRRGFVKTEPGKRYFVYDDGTPFFYLGDTHWAMLAEEIDEPGPHAGDLIVDSCFRCMADKRAEQGFTVYQSEPIGHRYEISDGIDAGDVEDFRRVDRYFDYIAKRGMVHANAELIFPSEVTPAYYDHDFLYAVTRYWVARYAAYPVLWTLGQEVDDARNQKGPEGRRVYEVYLAMCGMIAELDPYHHPITAHQLNAIAIGAAGDVPCSAADGGYSSYELDSNGRTMKNQKSVFYGVPGHTWWGVQWRPDVAKQYNFGIPKDYWYHGEGKVGINYETRYDYLYTKNFGARASGWISYLCGLYGYGYGAADIWCYKSTYSFNEPSRDGIDTVTPEEKRIPWSKALFFPTGDQMTLMRRFFEALPWYRLVPDFDEANCFSSDGTGNFAAAHDGDAVTVVYLYSKNKAAGGKVVGLCEHSLYRAEWFDPRTGEQTVIGTYHGAELPAFEKPAADDMVLLVTKCEGSFESKI